jgi:hypothetical protein
MQTPMFERRDLPLGSAMRPATAAAGSLSAHAAVSVVVTLILLMPAPPPRAVEPAAMTGVARIHLPPVPEPPIAIDEPVKPEDLSGYDISGLPFDMLKIARRRHSLFPFLNQELDFLDRIANEAREAGGDTVSPLAVHPETPPLELHPASLQQVIDDSYARRYRWIRFGTIATLLTTHDAQGGDAPGLIRSYLDQNLLQPYCHGRTKDGQFWALLENAADHADFLEFIRDYSKRNPASRTTTELLFLVDELAQASREAALTVSGTLIHRDLLRTAVESPSAAKLAADVDRSLRDSLAARGLAMADLPEAYDGFRLRVLATIVETTPGGYREADARFLAGQIFFMRRDYDQALQWWKAMRPIEGDSYAPAARAIANAIRGHDRIDVPVIGTILSRERARWNATSYERLRQFGYRCDTY